MHTLYLVGTPIGNLEDVTLRALRVLREVALIAAEDTRRTRVLLARYDIRTRTTSFHEGNKARQIPRLVARLEHEDVALVTEAGMPGISDPGYDLARAARERGAAVVVVPGPSAATMAVVASGLPSDRFLFLGFLPRKSPERRRALRAVAGSPWTLVVFEAPRRLRGSLRDMLDTLGDRGIAVCREMTKLHEEVYRGTVSDALGHFDAPRGEFTLVVAGATEGAAQASSDEARQALLRLRAEGLRARESVAQVAEATGLSHRALYRMWLDLPHAPERR